MSINGSSGLDILKGVNMLSKGQAKTFFLLGTFICAGVFVALTFDTFNKIPAQTNQKAMDENVIAGKHLFDKNNCMGCHTILGEGAYYAPELTKVYDRRGEIFIKSMLKDPQAMYPKDRKMTNYHFSDKEIDQLTAFLKWIGTLDLNGYPAKPDLAQVATPNASAKVPLTFQQLCVACHTVKGSGGIVGPKLDGVASRLDEKYLTNWLHDPLSVKADAKMPKLPLTEEQITELVQYLLTLKD